MLDPRRDCATGCLGAGHNPRGSSIARRSRSWIHCSAQASAASSDARPTKGLRDWMPRCWAQPPWVELSLDARVPGFTAAPKPTPRRAMLDPRKPPWVGLRPTPAFLDSLLRPSPRRVERCSTHEGAFANGCRGAENNPRGSGFARRPCSWIHRCAQAIAASSCSSTHEILRDDGTRLRLGVAAAVPRSPSDACPGGVGLLNSRSGRP